jgi:hypothetical protein
VDFTDFLLDDHPSPPPARPRDGGRAISLTEKDYRPLAGYPFQRWGERTGLPFASLRPLGPDAARRAWRRTAELAGGEWDGGLPPDRYPSQSRLDLRDPATPWDEGSVRDWLLARFPDRDRRVLACYGPDWAVEIGWGTFCDHWLTFLWVDACAWPVSEQWFLRYCNDAMVFGA